MEIVNARPEHFPQIYSLICELEEASLDRSKLEAVYLRNLADPGIHYLIALENGEAAGFASIKTFNRVFKESTGLSPTQYQKSIFEEKQA